MSPLTASSDNLDSPIAIENPFEEYCKQFDSPSGICGPTAVPALDCDYLRTKCRSCNVSDSRPVVDECTYSELAALVANSEAGSPRPRRHINAIRRLSQQPSISKFTLDCASETRKGLHRNVSPSIRRTTHNQESDYLTGLRGLPATIMSFIMQYCDGSVRQI